MNTRLTHFIDTSLLRLENVLSSYIKNTRSPAVSLQHAMDYSLSNGGKRIRPLLVYATGLALDTDWQVLDAPAAAIEIIHTYSLIHDDLPAMDNADLRRGKPACHKAFNEALAILAGDALLPLAFEIIACHPCKLSATQRIDMIHTLTHASGIHGMAAGQALDLQGVNTLEALTKLYQLKTGVLFSASITLGVLAANNTQQTIHNAFNTFSNCLGLAFQIQDDLLDIESTADITGKSHGLDAIHQKITYPTLVTREKAIIKIHDLYTEALDAIAFLGPKADILRSLADYLLQRKK